MLDVLRTPPHKATIATDLQNSYERFELNLLLVVGDLEYRSICRRNIIACMMCITYSIELHVLCCGYQNQIKLHVVINNIIIIIINAMWHWNKRQMIYTYEIIIISSIM